MQLAEIIQDSLDLAWWVEIVTEKPRCSYYFGPFEHAKLADIAQAGYIEDLAQEGAEGIAVHIKWYKPNYLTACEDELVESIQLTELC
ncbi:DUF1816 domain-containing protein [Iningainema tapete]|uniref:DUF1816 domain-containing protein n=1 Tax=Iningainema tapete BLCC-T55 TaxID=2748662 RepID=A0A8J6XPS4_9CYAN|nr:DUF1816 domain-containing protein [Iningainema tapete]MBD2777207.1 DUF1816 domain-containing protein [Iningainema tapete BLCC-T55]